MRFSFSFQSADATARARSIIIPFGCLAARLRTALGTRTIEEMARESGVPLSTIKALEMGRGLSAIDQLDALAVR